MFRFIGIVVVLSIVFAAGKMDFDSKVIAPTFKKIQKSHHVSNIKHKTRNHIDTLLE